MKLLCIAALLSAVVGGPAFAEDFGVPVEVPNGSVIELTIEKNGEQTVNGTTTKIGDMSFRYRQEIAATDTGYTVTQTALDMQGPPEAKASLDEAMAATKHITYDADERLAPLRIRDADALIAAITKTEGATPEQLKAQEQAMAMFKRMSPEHLAGLLLREQAMAAAYQGLVLPIGETVEGESETPNPFGAGPAIKQTVKVTLASVDREKGVATIQADTAADPASFKAALPEIVRQIAPADAPAPTAEELAQLTFEKSNSCRYEIDLKTGLATKAECTDIKGAGDGTGSQRSVQRMRITQKLITP